MTREIKFRAWDKDEERWIDPERIYIGGNGDLLSYGSYDDTGGFDTEIDIQFFTGLKDKDGVEVYEGDILETISVSIRDILDPYPHRRIIAWNEDNARLDFHWIDGNKQTSGQIFCKNNLEKNWKVIGNIYQK